MTIYDRREGIRFFIVGSARSGTTLLRLMLNAHSEVAVPPESRFVVELWEGKPEVDLEELLHRLEGHPRFEAWDTPLDSVREELGAGTVRYVDAIAAVYRAYAHLHGKVIFGDKTPRYVENMPLLAELYPEARFVHLVRDGRNVALSYANVPFGPKNVVKAADLWAKRVLAGIEHGKRLGPERYTELRYEQLVDDAEGRVKALCDFLKIDFDPGMLDYTEKARSAVLPKAQRYNQKVTGGITKNARSWEHDMEPGHVQLFEAAQGDVLSQLGYPVRNSKAGITTRLAVQAARAGAPVGKLSKREAASS